MGFLDLRGAGKWGGGVGGGGGLVQDFCNLSCDLSVLLDSVSGEGGGGGGGKLLQNLCGCHTIEA